MGLKTKVILFFLIVLTISNCKKEERVIPIDVAISSKEKIIFWETTQDLETKIRESLVVSYDKEYEGKLGIALIFNEDSSEVTASLSLKNEEMSKF